MKNGELEINNGLPTGWAYAGLEDISDVDRHSIKRGPFGSALKKEFFVPDGYKVYEQGNVINNDFNRGTYFINDEKFEDLKSFSIKPKDILMSCAGTVGKLAIVPNGVQEGVINQALLKLSVHPDIDLQYFFKLFTYQIDEILKSNLRGSAMMNLTSVKDLKLVKFPIAPLNEQKRIVAKIEKLFSNLDNSDKYLLHLEKQLKRYRQSVLKSAFEGELTKEWRKKQSNLETADELLEKIKIEQTLYIENEIREKFKDKPEKWIKNKVENEVDKFYSALKPIEEDDKPFTIPTQWEWHLIQESTIKIHYGYTATSDKNIDGIGYLRITDIQNNKVNWDEVPNCIISEEEVKKYELEDDNIVFARTGATVGKSFLIKDIPIRSVFASYLIRLIPSNQIYSNYIYKFFQSPIYWNQIRENESGIGQPNVNAEKLSNLIFPLCSLEEQIEVVAEIEKHFSIIDKLETVVQQSIKESKRLRQSILKQAFEGKLVEQDPNDESASVLLEKIAKAKEEYLKVQKKQTRKK
ncbi:restriction endonuclease subunit S [Aliarcobacter skirrowii]|uniref:restriction endonuclease subunit S n=1 Tax=Aliarcobacter skirrowii TaxID=28200 RepID=UPI0029ADE1CF|nr:restriction endonuclease subunit S [Aliarcobacter skirrowii]MDX4037853.1 restriction endonuclease subunit S [Aliarcobacter skirrowii]